MGPIRHVPRGIARSLLEPVAVEIDNVPAHAPVLGGRSPEGEAVPMATMPSRLSLCPQAVPLDKSPIDLEAEAGSVVEVQVTVAQFRMLAEEAVSQRISLRPTV
jgi:hypothetical protein